MRNMGRLAELINRLVARMGEDERRGAPGVYQTFEAGGIDDGDYGDPERDTRPEIVREDSAGWQSLPVHGEGRKT